MDSRKALYILLTVLALSAAVSGYLANERTPLGSSINLALNVVVIAFTYLWYYHDASERNFKRSVALGGAIVLFPVLSVPYYLIKSRPAGQRGKSILKFLSACTVFVVVLIVSVAMGSSQQ